MCPALSVWEASLLLASAQDADNIFSADRAFDDASNQVRIRANKATIEGAVRTRSRTGLRATSVIVITKVMAVCLQNLNVRTGSIHLGPYSSDTGTENVRLKRSLLARLKKAMFSAATNPVQNRSSC